MLLFQPDAHLGNGNVNVFGLLQLSGHIVLMGQHAFQTAPVLALQFGELIQTGLHILQVARIKIDALQVIPQLRGQIFDPIGQIVERCCAGSQTGIDGRRLFQGPSKPSQMLHHGAVAAVKNVHALLDGLVQEFTVFQPPALLFQGFVLTD